MSASQGCLSRSFNFGHARLSPGHATTLDRNNVISPPVRDRLVPRSNNQQSIAQTSTLTSSVQKKEGHSKHSLAARKTPVSAPTGVHLRYAFTPRRPARSEPLEPQHAPLSHLQTKLPPSPELVWTRMSALRLVSCRSSAKGYGGLFWPARIIAKT